MHKNELIKNEYGSTDGSGESLMMGLSTTGREIKAIIKRYTHLLLCKAVLHKVITCA